MSAEKTMGTTLENVSSTPVAIAGLQSIGEIGLESSELDATSLDSANGFKEKLLGLKDAGDVALQGVLKDSSNLSLLLGYANAQTLEDWKVTFPGGDEWTFSAFVKAVKEGEITVDGLRTFTATIAISGEPVFTESEDVSA